MQSCVQYFSANAENIKKAFGNAFEWRMLPQDDNKGLFLNDVPTPTLCIATFTREKIQNYDSRKVFLNPYLIGTVVPLKYKQVLQ